MNSRILTYFLLASASLFAAEPPALSDADKINVLKQIAALSQRQVAVYQANQQLSQAQQALKMLADKFQQDQDALRKKMGVDAACNLNAEAIWTCPPAEEAKTDAP